MADIPEIPPSPQQFSVDLYALLDVEHLLPQYGYQATEILSPESPLMSERPPIPKQHSIHLYPLEEALLFGDTPKSVLSLEERGSQNAEAASEPPPFPERLQIDLYSLSEVGRMANTLDSMGGTAELRPSPQRVSVNLYSLPDSMSSTVHGQPSHISNLSDIPPSPTHMSIGLYSLPVAASPISTDTRVYAPHAVEDVHLNLTESTPLPVLPSTEMHIEDEEDWLRDEEELNSPAGSNILPSVKLADKPEPRYPSRLEQLAGHIGHQNSLPPAFRRFLWTVINPDSDLPIHMIPLDECPSFTARMQVYHSATAYFNGPSDPNGESSTHHERIRSTPSQENSPSRRDVVFVKMDPDPDTDTQSIAIARVNLFIAFKFRAKQYSCAFVQWFEPLELDPETGSWKAKLDILDGQPNMAVIEVDRIARRAHLLPNFENALLDSSRPSDTSQSFSLNFYIDYNAYSLTA